MSKFISLNHPLEFDVRKYDKKTNTVYVAIPKGAENVKVSFGSAPWTYVDDNGKVRRGNRYLYQGKVY